MAVILLYLPIYAVLWLRSLWTQPAHIHRSTDATRARHRQAGTIGVCLILGIATLWYGSILVYMSLPRTTGTAPEVALEIIEAQHARGSVEAFRQRFGGTALP